MGPPLFGSHKGKSRIGPPYFLKLKGPKVVIKLGPPLLKIRLLIEYYFFQTTNRIPFLLSRNWIPDELPNQELIINSSDQVWTSLINFGQV